MLISICIPQYNRTENLVLLLESIRSQTYSEYEVCISDGKSDDNKKDLVHRYIKRFQRPVKYYESNRSLRYDENLRSAISISSGDYCLLMGNDDMFNTERSLEEIAWHIKTEKDSIGVVIPNYYELSTRVVYRRSPRTGTIKGGFETAARSFRNMAFVSGLVLDGRRARASATSLVDGSEMYQMYLGSKILSEGYSLLRIDKVIIVKDTKVDGCFVDDITLKELSDIQSEELPMVRIPETVVLGIISGDVDKEREVPSLSVCLQCYLFTYAYWIIFYKRIHGLSGMSWYARQISPTRVLRNIKLSRLSLLIIWASYIAIICAGLIVPVVIFERLRPILHRIAKVY